MTRTCSRRTRGAGPALAIAAALLAASASAQAQVPSPGPSVVLYGLIDLAVASVQGASGGVNANDRSVRQVLGGGLSTSHIGLRGNEDLGGGWVASFELSSFLRPDTGAVGRNDAIGAPVNVAADPFWSRMAWVGLGSASAGRLRLGNITSLLFVNSITSNAFGDSTVFSPLNLVTFIGGPLTGGTGWTNQVVYDSPRWGGFGVSAAVAASEGQGGRNSAARAHWAEGPASVSLAWQNVKKDPTTFADGTSPNNTVSWQLAAAYDFRVVKLWAHLGRIDNRGTEAVPQSVGYRVWDISGSMPIGAGRVVAGVARRHTGDTPSPVPATAAGGNVRRTVSTAGYQYDLSRRSEVYLLLMRDDTETRTVASPPTVVSARGTTVGVGLRHRF